MVNQSDVYGWFKQLQLSTSWPDLRYARSTMQL